MDYLYDPYIYELLLRKLIRDIVGPTTSDTNFTGPIGKMLNNVTELGMNTDFQVLYPGEPLIKLPDNVINMSTDQRLAHQPCQSVESGVLPQNLPKSLFWSHEICMLAYYCHENYLFVDQES